jgi:hypothetical protein
MDEPRDGNDLIKCGELNDEDQIEQGESEKDNATACQGGAGAGEDPESILLMYQVVMISLRLLCVGE